MAEGSDGERGTDALRFADDTPAEAPGVSGSEAGDEVAALHAGHLADGFLFEIAFPAGLAAAEDHLGELRVVRRGGKQAAVRQRIPVFRGGRFSIEERQIRFDQPAVGAALVGWQVLSMSTYYSFALLLYGIKFRLIRIANVYCI